jgi:hypothetical protein
MKKYRLKFLTALIIANLMGCGNSHNDTKIDTNSNQTLTKKPDSIKQNNTLSLG